MICYFFIELNESVILSFLDRMYVFSFKIVLFGKIYVGIFRFFLLGK